MKVLVIDNELNIRESVIEMIRTFCSGISELYEADGVESGIQKIVEINPDVVLLDVELDDGTGMDLLNKLSVINFHLIFITAHNKYAIDAFKFSATDFLLKPISPDELMDAFEKVKQHIKNKYLSEQLQVMQQSLNKINSKEKKIVLKDSNSIYFVNVDDIIRCESDGQYTEFFTVDSKKIVISKSLKEYEELLSPFGFIRPHHSHLINTNKILRFDKINGGSLIMEDQTEVPVSHRKKADILNLLDNL